MERYWNNNEISPPKEGGRYWCLVEEQDDLGKSTFQWNCYYDASENSWSDNFKIMHVTHWTYFLDSPE